MNMQKRETEYGTLSAETTIRKWGNSQGIRISKEIMNYTGLNENDRVKIVIYNGKMVIEKVNKPKYSNLQERLEAFYDKPIESIFVESSQEIDTGEPLGGEIW